MSADPLNRAVDVVVVGSGGAGLSAAVRAAELGASVVVIEKNARLGGTTAMSVGAIAASASLPQARAGITDSPDQQFADMSKLSGPLDERDNLTLRRRLVENSGPTMDWLISHGVAFYGPIPDNGLNSVPRLCSVLPSSTAYIDRLSRAARRLGVRIDTGVRVDELLVADGAAAGVAATAADGRRATYRAPRVILAAGDFSNSPELKRDFGNPTTSVVDGANPTSTGDGIRLGLDVGGHVLNGDLERGPLLTLPMPRWSLGRSVPALPSLTAGIRWLLGALPTSAADALITAMAIKFLTPSGALFERGAILVNRHGQRFMDERSADWRQIVDEPQGDGFIVLDGTLVAHFNTAPNYAASAGPAGSALLKHFRRYRPQLYTQAKTLDRLARRIGVPPDALMRTIGEHNQSAGAVAPLRDAPFVALGPVAPRLFSCSTGLAVDHDLRVLRNDTAIAGLYAVGSTGQSGLLLQGLGLHLGWAFISGRLAAEHAVRPDNARHNDTSADLRRGDPPLVGQALAPGEP